MEFTDLFDAEFISIETFRKNGKGVSTPVWQTPEDGKMYVWTVSTSGKVKRIRNNNHIRVCRCDVRGNPLSDWVNASARLLDNETDIQQQRQRLAAKYGERFKQFDEIERERIVIEIGPEEE